MKYALDKLQRVALSLMGGLVVLTFLLSNAHALLWQSSQWLVSTVLPSVVVELTNDEREDNNVAPLRRNATLDAAAKLKAQHMANNEYFAHYAPDGTSPWYWFDEAGYVYAHAGENLAIHFTDSDEVVEAWMNSPTHRKNIVDTKFTEIGVGTARGEFDGYKTVYVVQLFGAPAVAQTSPSPAPEPQETVVAVAEAEPVSEAVLAAEIDSEVETEPVNTEPDVVEEQAQPDEDTAEVLQINETETQSNVAQSENTVVSIEEQPEIIPFTPELQVVNNTVVVESPTIATSSGFAAASIENTAETNNAPIAGFATRPHLVLEIVYALVALIVIGLLVAALIIEARKVHPVQVAYSTGMLAAMALLLWVHTTLIEGAVII